MCVCVTTASSNDSQTWLPIRPTWKALRTTQYHPCPSAFRDEGQGVFVTFGLMAGHPGAPWPQENGWGWELGSSGPPVGA